MADFSMHSEDEKTSKSRVKIFHLVGGIISIAQLVGAIFLPSVRLVSKSGDYVQMTWDIQFSGSVSIPNPNVTYLEATSQLIGVDLSVLQPLAGFLTPQIFIIAAAVIFIITLLLRALDIPMAPFILGKVGSLACAVVLLMVFSVLTVSGALSLILSREIDYVNSLVGSLGMLLVITGGTSGLGS